MAQVLNDRQRNRIHDLALEAREILMTEARELLEGVYGLYEDGRVDPPEKLPQVQKDPEVREIYHRLVRFLEEEDPRRTVPPRGGGEAGQGGGLHTPQPAGRLQDAGGPRPDPGHAGQGHRFQWPSSFTWPTTPTIWRVRARRGRRAYRHFLLWQAGQVAQEVRVLFDPDTLASRLFPRRRALRDLLALLNDPALEEVWLADETVGWVYQYFNEPELQAAFEKVSSGSGKFEARDIPQRRSSSRRTGSCASWCRTRWGGYGCGCIPTRAGARWNARLPGAAGGGRRTSRFVPSGRSHFWTRLVAGCTSGWWPSISSLRCTRRS